MMDMKITLVNGTSMLVQADASVEQVLDEYCAERDERQLREPVIGMTVTSLGLVDLFA